MRKALGSAALSCALGLVDAKALKWSDNGPRWVPPQETLLGYMPSLGMDPPTPTPPPEPSKVKGVLEARASDDNTCGYISGILTSSLWCNPTARCVYNSINFHIGCCDDSSTNCPIWTTCFDSTDRASYTTDNGRTLWCGDSSYPHCITHLYQDSSWSGYSLMGCAVAAGTGKVWYTPFVSSTSTSSSSRTTRTTDTSSSSSASFSSSSSSSFSLSGATTTPSPSPEPASSSTPVGPIVGGVVGGVAAIALIVLGIWALMRQNNKQKKEAAAAAAGTTTQHQQTPPPGPTPQQQDPHMSQLPPQQGYYGPAAGYNPHDSMAKPPGMVGVYSGGGGGYTAADQTTVAGSSPPGSPPPPPGYMHGQGTSSPPPQQQQQQGQFGYGQQQPQQGYGQQQQQQQQFGNVSPGTAVTPLTTVVGGYQQQQSPPLQQGQGFGGQQQQQGYGGYAAELPAQRGDGELRELQG